MFLGKTVCSHISGTGVVEAWNRVEAFGDKE
jgi:hypothetical protein